MASANPQANGNQTGTTTDTNQETTIAAVGRGFNPKTEVPTRIGKFDVWDCPNNDTVVYKRVFTPRDDLQYPRLVEKVGITLTSEEWHVTRSVVFKEASQRHNVRTGEPFDTIIHDQQDYRCVGVGFETFDDALSFATPYIKGLSRNGKPKEVKHSINEIHRLFRELRLEIHTE